MHLERRISNEGGRALGGMAEKSSFEELTGSSTFIAEVLAEHIWISSANSSGSSS